jgi:F-type H+-transporting ATPase subunit gamma
MSANQGIRSKMKSIEGTRKITSAMQLVAASKMKKAQELMMQSRPYSRHVRSILGRLLRSVHIDHELFEERPVKKIAYVIMSSKRGLCGGLNNNLFKLILKKVMRDKEQGIESVGLLIGSKAIQFFRNSPMEVLALLEPTGDTPTLEELIGVIGVALHAFETKYVDELILSYSLFKNSMTQEPTLERLLPLVKEEIQENNESSWEYLYDESPKVVIDFVLTRYIEGRLYQAVLENYTSEQAARMLAMKSATDNAKDFIAQLKLIYNKARQAAITQEIIEIISGAAAVVN